MQSRYLTHTTRQIPEHAPTHPPHICKGCLADLLVALSEHCCPMQWPSGRTTSSLLVLPVSLHLRKQARGDTQSSVLRGTQKRPDRACIVGNRIAQQQSRLSPDKRKQQQRKPLAASLSLFICKSKAQNPGPQWWLKVCAS